MKSSGAVIAGWGASGLMIGAAMGLLQPGMREVPAKKPAAVAEVPPVAQLPPGKAAPAGVREVPETGSRELRLLERLARASRAELEVLTREMIESGADYGVLQSLWDRWIEVDAEKGFALLRSGACPAEPPNQPFFWSYLGQWSLRDPDAAVSKMPGLDQWDINVVGSRISHALSAKRPADFFRFLPELRKGHDADYCLATAAYNLAVLDPAAAVKLLEAWPSDGEKNRNGDSPAAERARMLGALALGWAKTDPEAALAWARALPDSGDRVAGIQNVVQRIARGQPDLAVSLLTELYGAPSQNSPGGNPALAQTLKQISRDWVAADPNAALSWLTERFGEEGKSVAREMVTGQIPRESGAAVDYMLRHFALLQEQGKIWTFPNNTWSPDDARAGLARAAEIPDSLQRQTVEAYFLKALARKSPEAAIEGAQRSLDDPGARGAILGTAMAAWAQEDITAASGWLQSQSAGAERDSAIRGMLPVALRTEPDSALQWAAALSSAELRAAEIVTVLRHINRRGNEEVREALAGVPLAEAEINAILLRLNPPPVQAHE